MAVKKGQSWLIGHKIHGCTAVVGHDYCVLDESCCLLSIEFNKFQLVTVQMQGVGIVGPVAEDEAVAGALFQHKFAVVGVLFAIYEPAIELSRAAGDLLEDHIDGLVWWRTCGVGFAEDCVIPGDMGWWDPLGLAVNVGVFHDYSQAGVADNFGGGA